jgi:hypothetical protein
MFTNINSIEEIQDSNDIGFLYIFDASNYDNDISLSLEDVVKIGMTKLNIKSRLNQYKSSPKNISYINCSEPSKRERLLKNYIKEKLNIKPVCGSEYFKGCREGLEKVILYFAKCDLESINNYYDSYNDNDKKSEWFNSIDLNHEFPEPLYKCNNVTSYAVKKCEFTCAFCQKEFALKKTLDVHVKTNKKCISSRPNIDISCIWCKANFLTNIDLEKHYKKCDVDKYTLHIRLIEENRTKDIILKEKNKEIERLNNIIKDLTNKIKR